jgi:hypothetical protein
LGPFTFQSGQTTFVGLHPVYLPDVHINDWGWNSRIVIRNNSNTNTANGIVSYVDYPGSDRVFTQSSFSISSNGTLFLDVPFSLCYYCHVPVLVAASEDISIVVENYRTGDTEQTNYTGVLPLTSSEGSYSYGWENAGSALYAPQVKRNRYGRSTALDIYNVGDKLTSVYFYYYDDNGSSRYGGVTPIRANAMTTILPSGTGNGCGADNTICTMRLFTDNGSPIVGVAREYNESNGLTVTTHNLFADGAATIYFPVVKYQRYNMTTGLRVQNVSNSTTSITVKFYNNYGTYQSNCDLSYNLYPYSAVTLGVNGACLGSNFVGTAIVTASSGRHVVGMANESSTSGQDLKKAYSSFQAGSLKSIGALVYGDQTNWNSSGVAVMNITNYPANNVTLCYYNTGGNQVGSCVTQSIPSHGMSSFSPPAGLTGSVSVSSDREIAVVVNIVSKATSGDTHAIYNANAR